MDRTTSTAIVIVVILLAFVGMYFGWRARRRRQSTLPRPSVVPADAGSELFAADVFYVATTVAGDPLNRIAVGGLGFRSKATVAVLDHGLVLSIADEPDAWIPAGDIRGVERATWTIDRVVERGGLVLIAWTLGDKDVDSYLRVADPADPRPLIDAVESLLDPSTTQGSETQ
ncbi:hypothetical protein [Glaciihabitans sp. UYNi722]|uniref:PH-like domain-containing protein n=1 Tax=Glaciihabitans sp. UYNi722 TaxID=3156344 RepID=UPI003393C4D1